NCISSSQDEAVAVVAEARTPGIAQDPRCLATLALGVVPSDQDDVVVDTAGVALKYLTARIIHKGVVGSDSRSYATIVEDRRLDGGDLHDTCATEVPARAARCLVLDWRYDVFAAGVVGWR